MNEDAMVGTRLPTLLKVTYSVGQFGVNIPTYFIATYLFVTYAPIGGKQLLSSALVGTAFLAGTVVQALLNPFIGQWSDKLRWKMGRRRPFIMLGTIPLAFTLFLMFSPPSTNQTINFAYLLLDFVFYNVAYVVVVLPYLAMIPEISVSSQDRVRLLTISMYFTVISTILSLVIAGVLISIGFDIIKTALVMALIIGVSFYIPVFTIKIERFGDLAPKSFSFVDAIVNTFKNKTFNVYMISLIFIIFGVYTFLAAFTYYIGVVVFPGTTETQYESIAPLYEAVVFLVAAISSPLLVKYSDRKGKKKAMVTFSAILGIGMIILSTVGLTGFSYYLFLTALVIVAIGATAPLVLLYAILSDIIDEDELLTGYRREGMYFGMEGLIERIPILSLGFSSEYG